MTSLNAEQRQAVSEALAESILAIAGELREGETAEERQALITGVVSAYNVVTQEGRLAEIEDMHGQADKVTEDLSDFSQDDG